MFKPWLDARDAQALRSAWRALSPRRHELAHPHRKTTTHGAALLAGAMLGERADWLVGLQFSSAKPDKEDGGEAADTFLDDTLDTSSRYGTRWRIFERIDPDGTRGVQCVFLEISTLHPPYEGGVFPVVRIFDRDRAVSVSIDANHASTIGDVDLAPLDLYAYARGFELQGRLEEMSTVEGLVATTRTLVERLVADEGERSISVVVTPENVSEATATVQGLPWGHHLDVRLSRGQATSYGYLNVRLPDAAIDRVLARLGAMATLR